MIVVDVGLLAYLLIDGEHTAKAEAILEADPEWASALSWRSEWRNMLAGYQRRGLLTQSGALERTSIAQRIVRSR